MLEGRGHDVLGQAVQPVRQRAAAGWPPRGKPLVAPPAQQEGPGGQRLVECELAELWVVFDQADPAASPEAFVPGRVLDDSVERDVLADDDLSHFGSPSVWCCQLPLPRAVWVVRIGIGSGLFNPRLWSPGPAPATGALLSAAGPGAAGPARGRSRPARRRPRRRTGTPRSARQAGSRRGARPGSPGSGR